MNHVLNLRFKLIALVTLVLGMCTLLPLANNIRLTEDLRRAASEIRRAELAPLLSATLAIPVFEGDVATLNDELTDLVTANGIVQISVEDTRGRILSAAGDLASHTADGPSPAGRTVTLTTPISLSGEPIGTASVLLSTKALDMARDAIVIDSFLISLSVAVASILVLAAFGYRLARRLAELEGAAVAVAGGDLSVRAPSGGRDEIAKVADAFNAMLARLKATQDKLKFEKTQLDMAIQSADAGVYDMPASDGRVYRSQRLLEIIGLPHLPSTRQAWQDRIHPDDVDTVLKTVEATQTGRQPPYRMEYRILHRDGEYRWLRERGKLFHSAAGKANRLVGMALDITEQKGTEATLRKTRGQLDALINSLPHAVYMKDTRGHYLLANPTHAAHLGAHKAGIPDTTERCFFSPETAQRLEEQDAQVISERRTVRAEVEVEFPDNRTRHLDITKFPVLDADGEVTAVGGMNVDVTERYRAKKALANSERRFQALADNLPYPLFMKNTAGEYILASAAFCRASACVSGGILGKTASDIFPPEIAAEFEAADRKVIAKRRLQRDEIAITSRDGKVRHLDITRFPVNDGSGHLIGLAGIAVDLTEQRHAEKAKQQAEESVTTLIENLPFPVFMKDLEGRFKYAGPLLPKRIGVGLDDIIGKTVHDFIPKDYADWYAETDRQVIESRQPLTFETQTDLGPGPTRTVEVTKYPVMDAQGTLIGIAGLSVDTTERRRIERELEENRGRLQSLIDNLPHPIYMKDRDGRFVLMSPAYARELEMDADEACGKTVFDFFEKEAAEAATALDNKVIETRAPVRSIVEDRLPRLHRGPRTYDVTKFPIFDFDDRLVGLAGMNIDITAQKQAEAAKRESEQRLHALIENLPFAMSMSDLAGRYVVASPVLARKLGCEISDLLGKTAAEVLPAKTASKYTAMEREVQETHRPVTREITSTCTANGERILEVTKFPILDADGNLAGFAGFNHDITDRRRAEARLAEAQRMEMVGQLAGGIAHDFNNLLALIRGNLEILTERIEPEPTVEKRLNAAVHAVQRGADLTERLLAVGRRQRLQATTVDVSVLLDQTIEVLSSALGNDIEIQVNYETGLWQVHIDPGGLEDALLNLALNARAAMPTGGELRIRADNKQFSAAEANGELQPGRYVIVSVEDTGSGIPSDVRPHVLEPFFTTKTDGTGLGLSVAYGFLRQSGGTLKIASREEQGTRVSLYLPCEAGRDATEKSVRVTAKPNGRSQLAVVVDDNPEMLELLVKRMRRLGFDTKTATETDTALTLLAQHPEASVLVTDVMLGNGFNGIALARAARGKYADLPVIFISGQATRSDFNPDGRTGFIRKPFGMKELDEQLSCVVPHFSATTSAQNV